MHILGHPSLMTLLARLCSPQTRQPDINRLTAALYRSMALLIADNELPRVQRRILSRMYRYNRQGVYEGQVVDSSVRVALVDIARAGIWPSHVCFETFCELLNPDHVRQDHIFAQRVTRNGRVTGTDLAASKIGGRYEGMYIVVPDPMAATGSSLTTVLKHLRGRRLGSPKKVIAAHLIVTPEYIRRMTSEHPDVVVYGVRLDRGLSTARVLRTIAGERWDEERGLNDHQYIVPGGGGFGELLSNAQE
ncbi:MAG: uracil phosphoribosyltransferase [Planctomycetes bacterium]|nr:uracil phosphoribosyltransferase [Planctomycetota bacterium]